MYLRVLGPAALRRDCYYLGDLGLTCWVNLDRTLQLSVLLLPHLLYITAIYSAIYYCKYYYLETHKWKKTTSSCIVSSSSITISQCFLGIHQSIQYGNIFF